MKVVYLGKSPSLTIRIKDKKTGPKSVVINGEGEISKADFEAVKDFSIVKTMVSEGELRFPEDKTMETLFQKKASALRERQARLSAVQDERKAQAAEKSESDDALLELAEENANMKKQLADMQDQLAKLEKGAL